MEKDGSSNNRFYEYRPWGELNDPVLMSPYEEGQEPELFLGRGYTGHEHLPWFKLINMNARLFDPLTLRFLSPDPYIQAPDYSQAYNRYIYCMNRPTAYTDPSGEIAWFVPIAVGAAVGAYAGASFQSGTAAFWNWSSGSWGGAIAGAFVGAAVGAQFSAAIGATGIMTNAVVTSPLNGVASKTLTMSSHAFGITSTTVNSASINIGLNSLSGGGWDGAWKAGLGGAATGLWRATGGFGMVKGFGSTNSLAKFGRKLGYQMIGTTSGSITQNWAANRNIFSKVTLGIGPINFTLGNRGNYYNGKTI
ncbi:MAG: hypothetical protein LUD15_11300 [Bacteroides sp.]|nr:hypothetical protein [Bacteroides sp.]